ncbi:S8 family peptidase [Bacillus halotolerans]|uniref:S8 family peptidase n=1 Tax=Bacillus halotolerans TaxID=260554 RepID=UPI001879561B|nr:S8 family serine peptidase [Bacillus halotolerans]MEC1543704.1 S8 family serine peptidase [Bacillus halotolerans]
MTSKRTHILLILFLGCVLIIPHQALAKDNQLNTYTVFLKRPNYQEEWIKTLEKRDMKLEYAVEEIGLYEVKAEREKFEAIIEDLNYVESYNESVSMQPAEFNSISMKNVINQGGDNSLWEYQWDMKKSTNNGKIYKITKGSKNTVVGIIDSGIDKNHLDLKDNILSVSNLVPKGGLRGQEPYENGETNNSTDYLGHGTFVAGQIAANGQMKGIAPEIGIRSYRVFGGKSADTAWIINAIIQAANDDVDVINVSLGTFLVKSKRMNSRKPAMDELAEIKAFRKAVAFAHKKGSAIVSSIGNEGLDLNDKNAVYDYWENNVKQEGSSISGEVILIPAQLPKVVTVASVGPSGNRSVFSNYGKNIADIAADGGDNRILNEVGVEKYYSEGLFRQEYILGATPQGSYTFSVGTSIAAPKISGALALLIDQRQLHDKPDKAIQVLLKNTDRYDDKDNIGKGVLNIYKALLDK